MEGEGCKGFVRVCNIANTPIYLILLKITYQGTHYKIKEATYLNKMCCCHLSTTKDQNVANKELNVLSLLACQVKRPHYLTFLPATHQVISRSDIENVFLMVIGPPQFCLVLCILDILYVATMLQQLIYFVDQVLEGFGYWIFN